MLFGFFRKYQKLIFGLVGGVVVLSFSFFGTYSALMSPGQAPELVARTMPDGTRVSAREWEQLVAFLRSSRVSAHLMRDPLQANLINDGVIEADLLATGVAPLLGAALGEAGAKELAEREARERMMPLYVHPGAPSITAQSAWEQFAPGLAKQWNLWMAAQGSPSDERWQRRAELYLAQRQLPPEWLRALLYQQEKLNKSLAADGRLKQIDLALFGYHSLEDWFGKPFVEQAASWILHGAMYAEQQGHHVSLEAARADLLRQGAEAFALVREDPRLEGVDFNLFFHHQLAQWGGDEELAVRLWQRVLLLRKLLSSQADVALGALLPYEQFGRYATCGWQVKRYELAPELRSLSPEEKGKLAAYVELLGPERQVPPIAEGIATAPHLVELASSTRAQLQAQIPLQLVRRWQREHWGQLVRQFDFLAGQSSVEALPASERRQVDLATRQQLLTDHPEWIQEQMAKIPSQPRELLVSYGDGPSPLAGLQSAALRSHLDKRSTELLEGDGHLYRIHVLSISEPQWLTFAEAKQLDLLTGHPTESHPLNGWLAQAREALMAGAPEADWTPNGDPLRDQWKLSIHTETVDRNHPAASLAIGDWTPITAGHFHQCIAQVEGTPLQIPAGERQLIETAARREMAQQLATAASQGAATLH
jgi:hypothetical protein